MTAENFDQSLRMLQEKRPFQIFSVALNDGQRFEIDLPHALVVRDGVPVFVASGGVPVLFDHDGIDAIIAGPANKSL